MSIQSLVKYAGSAFALCALQAGAVDLLPTMDTYVHSGSPTASNGTKTVLETKSAATSSRDSYLKFDLSAQSNITKVELKLYAKYNTSGSVTCGVHGVANTSWDEGMTWNTKAALGSQLATATATNAAAWITFDVTNYVLSEYSAGRKVVALGLHNAQTSTSHVTFNSKENTANKPVLVVTTSGGGGGGTNPQAGAMEYYDGSKWVTLPIGKPGQVLSVTSGKIPQWTQIPASVADIDGNIYKTVTFGNQEWTAENIRTTRYSNGDAIAHVENGSDWAALTSGAYCYYENGTNVAERIKYGALYNWYAINDARGFAPEGWRVASKADWDALKKFLMDNQYSNSGLSNDTKIAKALAAQTEWEGSGQPGAIGDDWTKNNRSGFSALPGGIRDHEGEYIWRHSEGYYWTSTEKDASLAYSGNLYSQNEWLQMYDNKKVFGCTVRWVRDVQ